MDLAARSRSQPSEDLDRFLTQPFHVSEHVTGRRGVSVALTDLRAGIADLVA